VTGSLARSSHRTDARVPRMKKLLMLLVLGGLVAFAVKKFNEA
jgi:hypothetical protein